jgi:hypothetical protein
VVADLGHTARAILALSAMTVTTGTWLGPYEILSPLGAGAVGELHRARDTKLERDVALGFRPAASHGLRSAPAGPAALTR